jgi:hypothetical protein
MVTRLPQPRRHKTQRAQRERRRLGRFVVFSEMEADLTPKRLIEPAANPQMLKPSEPNQQR